MTYVIAIMMMLIFRVSEMALIGTLFYCMYVHVYVCVCVCVQIMVCVGLLLPLCRMLQKASVL